MMNSENADEKIDGPRVCLVSGIEKLMLTSNFYVFERRF